MAIVTPSTLVQALADLPRDPALPDPRARRIPAAVALVLREGPLDLLLIRRAANPRDPWSGQMALPGGRLEPGDADLRATAVRETHEETGLLLKGSATYLGRLPTLEPATRRIPAVAVSPHVFLAPAHAGARVASREVASTHWVPLDALRNDDAPDEVEIHFAEGARRFPCFRVDGQVVWGLTYRIVTDFLRRLG